MTKHTMNKTEQNVYPMTIEGLPEGWEPVAYRRPKNYEKFLLDGEIKTAFADMSQEFLVIQQSKPRRIVSTGIDSYDPSSPNGYD